MRFFIGILEPYYLLILSISIRRGSHLTSGMSNGNLLIKIEEMART